MRTASRKHRSKASPLTQLHLTDHPQECAGFDVGLPETIESYVADFLSAAPDESLTLPPITLEFEETIFDSDART